MNKIEKDNLQDYLWRIENFVPKSWTLKGGDWDKFKTIVEELVVLADYAEESLDEMAETKEDIKQEIKNLIILKDGLLVVEDIEKELEDIIKNLRNAIG